MPNEGSFHSCYGLDGDRQELVNPECNGRLFGPRGEQEACRSDYPSLQSVRQLLTELPGTQEAKAYNPQLDGREYVLIDTPDFDEPLKSDTAVVDKILQ